MPKGIGLPKKKKERLWSLSTADVKFSEWIRGRDGKCLRCGRTDPLTNSHYWTRYYKSTRFDPENCITLCIGCHFRWEEEKQGEYGDFMLTYLGREKLAALKMRAHSYKAQKDAIRDCMILLNVVKL